MTRSIQVECCASGTGESMRIIAISDTHGKHSAITALPAGDVLVHAGDFMRDWEDLLLFNHWLGLVPFKHRIVCAGNHERPFQIHADQARSMLTNAIYLENSGVTIDGLRFWGSPYTPEFMDWAFMYPPGAGEAIWAQIPAGTDVLITHGPPYGILDQTAPGEKHLGCVDLLNAVDQKRPRVHIFGHIHGGAGTAEIGRTRFVNAAYLNEHYRPAEPAGKVQIIDIEVSAINRRAK